MSMLTGHRNQGNFQGYFPCSTDINVCLCFFVVILSSLVKFSESGNNFISC